MSMFKQFRNKKSEESPLQVLKAYIILDKSYSRKRNEMELSMILSCNHISKAFGTDEILSEVSFHIEDQEKAAIVGINGAGKSTLLKIIVGELSADSGEVVLAKGKTLGYLAQHQDLDSSRTIYEELKEVKQPIIDMEQQIRELELNMQNASGEALEQMLAAYSRLSHTFELENGYAWKSELTGVLKGLGFTEDEFDKTVSTLSGGQKTRVSLGKLLLSRPDIILLHPKTRIPVCFSFSRNAVHMVKTKNPRVHPSGITVASADVFSLQKRHCLKAFRGCRFRFVDITAVGTAINCFGRQINKPAILLKCIRRQNIGQIRRIADRLFSRITPVIICIIGAEKKHEIRIDIREYFLHTLTVIRKIVAFKDTAVFSSSVPFSR